MRAMALFGAGAAVVAAVYSPLLRRRVLTWGATREEVAAELPGDELLPDTELVSTRAIQIDAVPAAVWPWLVQMGSGRGGAYTYDWIENLLGLHMHSAGEILPQFQDLKVGDVLPLGENGPAMRVAICAGPRALVFCSQDGRWVWSFTLSEHWGGTRLVSRNRIAEGSSVARRVADRLIMEPGSLVMERKMLLGIRDRAEASLTV